MTKRKRTDITKFSDQQRETQSQAGQQSHQPLILTSEARDALTDIDFGGAHTLDKLMRNQGVLGQEDPSCLKPKTNNIPINGPQNSYIISSGQFLERS